MICIDRTTLAAAILLTFADDTLHPLTEISGLTGIPTSTVHRLVSELVASRFLERTDHGQYRVGVSLRAISAAADALPSLRKPADRTMEDLSQTYARCSNTPGR